MGLKQIADKNFPPSCQTPMRKSQFEHSLVTINSSATEEASPLNELSVANINEGDYISMPTSSYPVEELMETSEDDDEKHTREVLRSKNEEIHGIIKNGTLKVVDSNYTEKEALLFDSKFINILKPTSVGVRYKSRLVVHNYGNMDAAAIAAKAAAYQQFTQRLVLFLAACFDSVSTHTQATVRHVRSRHLL